MFEKKKLKSELEHYLLANQQSLYRLAYSYVKNPEDSLDIVQESIFKAISSVNSLETSQAIKTWVYRIVVNVSLDTLRKQKRVEVVDEVTQTNYSIGAKSDEYPDLDLEKALDQLPPVDRSRIILKYYEDLKLEDVAEILKENVNTTKTRLYATLKKLRLQMEDSIKEDDHER